MLQVNRIEFDKIKAAANANPLPIVERLVPGGTIRGAEYVARLRADDHDPSFKFNLAEGVWSDFGANISGDIIDLYAHVHGIDNTGKAALALGAEINALPPEARKPVKYKGSHDVCEHRPLPQNPPPFNGVHWKLGPARPEHIWEYRDAGGRTIGYTCRFDMPNGGKDIFPITWCYNKKTRQVGWNCKGFSNPRPLYGLDVLSAAAANMPVLIVEGEKTCEAARRLLPQVPCITWPGGGKAVKHVDFSPLAGRRVFIWPDADPQGEEAALAIAARLRNVAAGVKTITPPVGVAKGWDLADAEAEGWDYARTTEYLRTHAVAVDSSAADIALQRQAEPVGQAVPAGHGAAATCVDRGGWPFTPLGYDHGTYFYLSTLTGQVEKITSTAHTGANLLRLAGLDFWEMNYPGKTGASWTRAADACMQACHERGVYDPDRVRGRGAWEDDGRVVLHLGDQLVVDGEGYCIADIPGSRYVYEMSRPLGLEWDSIDPLGAGDAVHLMTLCNMLSWEKPVYGMLLAGWCVVAPICGALSWRPHIWVTGPSGSGKAQPHSAKVLTPDGWRTMGEMQVGDLVTTPDNGFGRVLNVYPQGVVPVYRLRFADGRETRATADHLWKVRYDNQWRLKTTEELIEITNRGGKISIPVSEALDIKRNRKEKLPMDPYVLGVLLGDGYLGHETSPHGNKEIRVTTADCEILMNMEERAPDMVSILPGSGDIEWRFKTLDKYGRTIRDCIKDLRLLGTRSGTKFIPEIYKRAAIEDRLELLRGLMDTDGTAGHNGSVSYCTISRQLADDVAYIVRSLGGTARIGTRVPKYTDGNGKRVNGKIAYVVNIRMRDRSSVFGIERKKRLACGPYQYQESFYAKLVSITPDGEEESSCIAIDHPDRLYVTDDFIVTHNTWTYDNILRRTLGRFALACQSNSTEAGLRQALKADAMPIIFDEAEGEDQQDRRRIQNVLELMRQASSENGAAIIKGSANGEAMQYRIRSCFAFSSIGVSAVQKADVSRLAVLSLRKYDGPDRAERFRDIQRFHAALFTGDFVPRLHKRTIGLVPTLLHNADVFADAAALELGSRRYGDQVGALLAGAYSLQSDARVTPAEAAEWVAGQEWGETMDSADDDDENRCIELVLHKQLRVETQSGVVTRTVAELARVALKMRYDTVQALDAIVANDTLARHGVCCDADGYICISDSHPAIADTLKNSPWAQTWPRLLRRINGATPRDGVDFGGKDGKATAIPAVELFSCKSAWRRQGDLLLIKHARRRGPHGTINIWSNTHGIRN